MKRGRFVWQKSEKALRSVQCEADAPPTWQVPSPLRAQAPHLQTGDSITLATGLPR